MDQRGASKTPHLPFDGDEIKHELWETKMLRHLCLLGLKVQREAATVEEFAVDEKKNDDAALR